jgi:hypothetical protein
MIGIQYGNRTIIHQEWNYKTLIPKWTTPLLSYCYVTL